MTLRALTALALTAACALPGAASAADLTPLASAAAGVSITAVHCDVAADEDAAGYTVVGGTEIWLTPDRCHSLQRLLAKDTRWLYRAPMARVANADYAGDAIQALVHEATHLRLASGDEGLVECAASRNYWPTVARLGLPARAAKLVLRAAVASHNRIHDPRYRAVC